MSELEKVLYDLFPKVDLDDDGIERGLLAFSEYDIKEQFPFNGYKERVLFGKHYYSEELKEEKTNAFFVYKALTIKINNNGIAAPSSFDPDNATGKCVFAKELYSVLWGFTYKYSYFGTIDMFQNEDLDNKLMLWGGDCLNSLQTTIKSELGYSTIDCIKKMSDNPETFIKEMKESDMGALFQISHAPGNFGIVPAYFNAYRGTSACLRDYLPQSLFFLKESQNYNYSLLEKLEAYTRSPKYNNGGAKQFFSEYAPKMFGMYVNVMMLWDLVSYNSYNQIDVHDYNGKKITYLPDFHEIKDVSVWSKGVNKFVRRRGLFIGALMYTYLYFKEEYCTIKSLIFVDEPMKKDGLVGYEAVFKRIYKGINNEQVKNTFIICQKMMNKLH
ncbi:hypothetical protein PRVXT_001550 [Proteinivorax tanatarense]|uniref:Uncharacterized protein n=1 Tax=Proteinivorax tanatarense TaxID=1260629 RepID=A0AAU7VHD2_9FIRM